MGRISQNELNDAVNTQLNKTSDIGDKTQLQTTNKTDLVSATNEVVATLTGHQADYAHYYKKDAGSTDAYVVALSPAITSYTEGMTLDIFCKNTNTGTATLDAGGGAKDLRKYYNDALETGDIEAGAIITVKWDSANDWWQVTSGIKVTVVDASTTVKGIVQLSSSAASTSTTLAATSSAVKAAYDFASSAYGLANSAAKAVSGTYTGDGTSSKILSLGFTPKLVIIHSAYMFCLTTRTIVSQLSAMGVSTSNISATNFADYSPILVSGGFQVSGNNNSYTNSNGITYDYTAIG